MTEEQHVQAAEKMKKDLRHVAWILDNVDVRELSEDYKIMFWEILRKDLSDLADLAEKAWEMREKV